jgi:outer membrane protein assembly factor BamB
MRGFATGFGVALVAVVLAGCASEVPGQAGQPATDTKTTTTTTQSSPPRKSFDPPRVFESAAVTLPPGTLQDGEAELATLSEGILYAVTAKQLQAVDPAKGDTKWSMRPKLEPAQSAVVHAPVIDESGTRLYAAFSVIVPGKGTTPAHPAIEVLAVDVKSGKQDWTATIDVETTDPGNVYDGNVTVVGVTSDSVVLTFFSSNWSYGKTYVLDTGTKQVRWNRDRYLAGDVDSGLVIGNGGKPLIGEARTLTALALADGAQKWSADLGGYGAEIMPVSAKLVAVNRRNYGNGDQTFEILDVASGQARYTMPIKNSLGSTYRISCFYDLTSIIVCDGNGGERTLGFDVNNVGKEPLWVIVKDPARVPPTISAAYHGLAYGRAGTNDPVALDAKTGKDAPDMPGVAPMLVDKYVAITEKQETYTPVK